MINNPFILLELVSLVFISSICIIVGVKTKTENSEDNKADNDEDNSSNNIMGYQEFFDCFKKIQIY